MFMKSLAIAGGFIVLAVAVPGGFSIGRTLSKARLSEP